MIRIESTVDFHSRLRAIAQSWSDAHRRMTAADAKLRRNPGEGALEAAVRHFYVNHLLAALNWRLGLDPQGELPNVTVEQAIDEDVASRVKPTRFMDYVGWDDSGSRALLVVETKRPSYPIPSRRPLDIATRLLRGLSDPALARKPWDCVAQLGRYVLQVASRQGHCPPRAAVTNGGWLVVFRDPQLAFWKSARDPGLVGGLEASIEVFPDLLYSKPPGCTDPVLGIKPDDAERLFCALECCRVAGQAPDMTPATVGQWLAASDVSRAAYATSVIRNRIGSHLCTEARGQQSLSAAPVLLLETWSGAWARVREDGRQIKIRERDTRSCASDAWQDTASDLRELRKWAVELRRHVESAIGGELPLAGLRQIQNEEGTRERLRRFLAPRDAGDEGVCLPTGDAPALWQHDGGADDCAYHWSEACRKAAAGDVSHSGGPAHSSSWSDPRCQFVDGEPGHCAHRWVAEAKARRPSHGQFGADAGGPEPLCRVWRIDERLCCRRCAYWEVCSAESDVLKQCCGA